MIMDGVASYNHGFDSLDIHILFLHATGTVLQQKFIYSSGYWKGSKVSGVKSSKPLLQSKRKKSYRQFWRLTAE